MPSSDGLLRSRCSPADEDQASSTSLKCVLRSEHNPGREDRHAQQLWTTFQVLQGLPTDQLALSVQKIPSSNAIEIGQTMQAVGRE